METQQKTVEEVIEYWSEIHKKDNLSQDVFKDNKVAEVCIMIAKVFSEKAEILALTLYFMNDFELDEKSQNIDKTSEFAEQIHLYFLGKEDKLEKLLRIAVAMNSNNIFIEGE